MLVKLVLRWSILSLLVVGLYACTDEETTVSPIEPSVTEEIPVEIPPTPSAEFVPETVYFAYDDYSLSPEAQAKLQVLADHMKANGSDVVQVEGHCDERGSVEYNLALGQKRAEAVRRYLLDSGVEASRVSTISYGEEKPAFDGQGESAWSQNRRSEFVLTQP